MEVLRYTAFPDGDDGGNPAAVVLTPEPIDTAGALAEAAEIGYSETVFVGGADNDGTRPLHWTRADDGPALDHRPPHLARAR